MLVNILYKDTQYIQYNLAINIIKNITTFNLIIFHKYIAKYKYKILKKFLYFNKKNSTK